jgi:hypothetical protein
MDNWNFTLLFHNLSIKESIGNEFIKVFPFNDPVVKETISKEESFLKFINSFKNQFGKPLQPALLYVAYDTKPDIEALVAFRNALAISSVAKNWSNYISAKSQFEYHKYSNYFDFYPYSFSDDWQYLIAMTPSVTSLDDVSRLEGQSSPELATTHSAVNFFDEALFYALLDEWVELYIKKKKNTWKLVALFRSLEMAYRAASLPFGNRGTIHDYGANLSLWVSAFEILHHPKNKGVGVLDVINSLGHINYRKKSLGHKRYSTTYCKKRISLTLIQKIYFEMFRARNSFLHGNPVTIKKLNAKRKNGFFPLNFIAPVVYKYALDQFLGINKPFDFTTINSGEIARLVNQGHYDESLNQMIKL